MASSSIKDLMRRRAIQGAQFKQSPALSSVIASLQHMSVRETADLLLAFGNPYVANEIGWIPTCCLPTAANMYAWAYGKINRSDDNDVLRMTFGNVTAMWTVNETLSADPNDRTRITAARSSILQFIRAGGINNGLLNAFMREVVKIFRPLLTTYVELPAQPKYLELINATNPPFNLTEAQWVWLCYGLDKFPWVRLTSMTAAFLTTIRTPGVDVAPAITVLEDLTMLEDAANAWSLLTDEEMTNVITAISMVLQKERSNLLIASIFVMAASICKSGNLTDAWLQSRLETLSSSIPNQDFEDQITTEIIKSYYAKFVEKQMKLDDIYKTIIYTYTIAKDIDANPIDWIFEQSMASNVTAATSFYTSCTRYKLCTYTVLVRVGVPPIQLKNIAKVALIIANNPFASLIAPPVPTADYADLAYIGTRLCLPIGGNKGYRGTSGANCTLSTDALDAFIEQCKNFESTRIKSAMDTKGLITLLGYDLAPDSEDKYRPPPTIAASPSTSNQRNVVQFDQNFTLSATDLLNKLISSAGNSLNVLGNEFLNVIGQHVLEQGTDAQMPGMYKPVSPNLRSAVRTMGYTDLEIDGLIHVPGLVDGDTTRFVIQDPIMDVQWIQRAQGNDAANQ